MAALRSFTGEETVYKINRVISGAILAAVCLTASNSMAQDASSPPMNKEDMRKMLQRTITRNPADAAKLAPKPVPSASVNAPAKPALANDSASFGNGAPDALDIDGNIIQFKDVDLDKFIESMAGLIQKNFDLDDKVKGKVTLIANEPISREMAYPLLESILQARGFTLVPTLDGQLIRIIQARRAPSSDIQVGAGSDPSQIEGYERFQTQLVPILYADAGEISQVMTSLINQEDGRADVYAPTNTIIITTTATSLRRLLDIIHQIDNRPTKRNISCKHSYEKVFGLDMF